MHIFETHFEAVRTLLRIVGVLSWKPIGRSVATQGHANTAYL